MKLKKINKYFLLLILLGIFNLTGCKSDDKVHIKFSTWGSETEVKILSVASGPALEIKKLIKMYPEISNRINLTLLDQEIKALEYSQDHIYENKIKYQSSLKVNFIHQYRRAFARLFAFIQ